MNDSKIAKSSLVTIRNGEFNDLPFIFSTWLKGLRWGNEYHKLVDQDAYFKGQHRVIEKILQDPKTEIKVACLIDAPEVIVAYAVYTGDTLHWVKSKSDWKNIGLAKDLVPKSITTVSNVTKVALSILKKHPNVLFNPYPTKE